MGHISIGVIIGGLLLFLGGGYYMNTDHDAGMMGGRVIDETHQGEAGEHMDTEMEDHHNDGVESYEIYPRDVVEKMQSNTDIVLLDVRRPDEYEEVHLKGAVLLPVEELSAKTLDLIGLGVDTKDTEIIIYCHSGARSKIAYNVLTSLGYTNIKSIAGGMVHWQEDRYPMTEVGVYTGPSWTTGSETATPKNNGPRIMLDKKSYDFGIIPQFGGAVETTFMITNSGTEVLTIGDITTSCSCTSATITESNIKAGKSVQLTVRFDPDFHEEPTDMFKRTVFIPTNDPVNPEAEISISVDIDEGV